MGCAQSVDMQKVPAHVANVASKAACQKVQRKVKNRSVVMVYSELSRQDNAGASRIGMPKTPARPGLGGDEQVFRTLGSDVINGKDGERVIALASTHMGPEEAADLAVTLPNFKDLRSIHSPNNEVGNAGAVALAGALPALKCLRHLNLAKNNIGVAGAKALAEALPHMPSLRVVHLEHNCIGEEGALALAAVLPELKELQELWLFGNEIGEPAAEVLVSSRPGKGMWVGLDESSVVLKRHGGGS